MAPWDEQERCKVPIKTTSYCQTESNSANSECIGVSSMPNAFKASEYLTGVIISPTQTMVCYQGKPQNHHRFVLFYSPKMGLKFNDPCLTHTDLLCLDCTIEISNLGGHTDEKISYISWAGSMPLKTM